MVGTVTEREPEDGGLDTPLFVDNNFGVPTIMEQYRRVLYLCQWRRLFGRDSRYGSRERQGETILKWEKVE